MSYQVVSGVFTPPPRSLRSPGVRFLSSLFVYFLSQESDGGFEGSLRRRRRRWAGRLGGGVDYFCCDRQPPQQERGRGGANDHCERDQVGGGGENNGFVLFTTQTGGPRFPKKSKIEESKRPENVRPGLHVTRLDAAPTYRSVTQRIPPWANLEA